MATTEAPTLDRAGGHDAGRTRRDTCIKSGWIEDLPAHAAYVQERIVPGAEDEVVCSAQGRVEDRWQQTRDDRGEAERIAVVMETRLNNI